MPKSKRRINIKPYNLESSGQVYSDGTFTMRFTDQNKEVCVKMDRWWIRHILKAMRDIIENERREIDEIEKGFADAEE